MSEATPDLATLRALEARLVAATGPDLELDARIALALDGAVDIVYAHAPGEPPEPFLMLHADGAEGEDEEPLTLYTASIDAAVALIERVLPDWQIVSLTKGWRGPGKLFDELPETLRTKYAKADLEAATVAHLRRSEHSYISANAEAPTPALALCIALVRAVIEQKENNDAG